MSNNTTRTIYVSRNGNSNQLKLRDSEGHNPGNDNLTTGVDPGDTVKWQLDSNSGLSSIEGVQQVTASDPSYNANAVNLLSGISSTGGVYTGTVVSPSPGQGKFENYKIGFKVPNDNNTYWDDPKLQMNK
ncbi:MAG: hypothetical protein R3345_12880 [Fulvivirga sp.]|nr:hypothetical protein [Fulvivirga sp.]